MTYKVAINGFGRIGRLVLRALLAREKVDIRIVAINDLTSLDMVAHLFEYDSVHGRFPGFVDTSDGDLIINDQRIKCLQQTDPAQLPWQELGVDLVLECTGGFVTAEAAGQHLQAGAQKVLISAPGKGVDRTVVFVVNDKDLVPSDRIVSNASCTTNCLAPLCQVLDEAFGIIKGHMTTIHAATGDQRTVDLAHSDPRRARATLGNIIPTSTGASKALKEVLPHLEGLITGVSYRVPTADVSIVDLVITTKQPFDLPAVQDVLRQGAERMPGILVVEDAELVSTDFVSNPASCTVDLPLLSAVGVHQLHVAAWYDNEWGFSNRMVDTALAMLKVA